MKRIQLTRTHFVAACLGAACLGLGFLVGLFVPQSGIRGVLASALGQETGEEEAADEHDHHDHGPPEGTVLLTPLQIENLELELKRVEAIDDTVDLRVPGKIIERPGFSDLMVASTVTGVVSRVHVVPGQAVRPGQLLVELRLTGAALATAQSSLLRELARLASIQKEIDRLAPLVKMGTVPGKQVIQLNYDKQQAESQIAVHRQELLLYGLNVEQVDRIVETGELVEKLAVRLPERIVDDMATTPISTGGGRDDEPSPAGDWRFTIEELDAHPGKSVKPGDPLVKLAHHTELFVQGQAFEHEIGWIEDLEARGWGVTLEHGTEGHESYEDGLRVLYMDNHVDEESRTFNFYVPLVNSPVLPDRIDGSGTVYRTWRYKPGQLVHVLVPQRVLENVYRVPLTAVADEGLESYVFRRGRRRAFAEDGEIVDKWEFVKTPVRIVHRSTTHAFLEPSDELPNNRTVVMNKAYLLLLATKDDGGGGHDHHHGHSH